MLIAPRTDERGVAMLAAIAMMILGTFIAISIIVSSRAGSELSRDRLNSSATEQLARDAGTVLAAAYSSLQSGEHDGFIPSRTVLDRHAARLGGGARVVDNSTLLNALGTVDPRVPGAGRFTLQQSLTDGRTGSWQIYSVKLPDWGTTPGGRVVAYVRTWTSSPAGTTRPSIYRLEFRPTWFADYQMLFDGPQEIGDGAVITGRVHSNGYQTSFYDQYGRQAQQIRFTGSARCEPSARVSTAQGSIAAPGGCETRADTGRRYNFLRARDTAARLRALCEGTGGPRPAIQMSCPATDAPIRVTLSGSTVSVAGYDSLSAAVPPGGQPSGNQGAVVVARGDVELSGTLGNNARALIVAATPAGSTRYGASGPPSVWVRTSGSVGANGDKTSSFGVVAEGDVIIDETRVDSATLRGAFLTLSGMVSSHPTWRTPAFVPGGSTRGTVRIEGSTTGHYPPLLQNPDGGFSNREYTWNTALYDNPPPMFPTAADWEVTRMEPANLDCFGPGAGGGLLVARTDCA